MASKGDLLTFAYSSFILFLYLGAVIQLASAGTSLLTYEQSETVNEYVLNRITVTAEHAWVTDFLTNNLFNSVQNNLAYDIVLSIVNVTLYLYLMLKLILFVFVGFFSIYTFLLQGGVPGAMIGILVFMWNFWVFWYLGKFFFKGERVGN